MRSVLKAAWEYICGHKQLFARLFCCLLCTVCCFILMAAGGGSGKSYIVLCFFLCFAFLFAAGLPKRRQFFFWLTPFVNFLMLECFYNVPFANIHLFTIGFNVLLFYLGFLLIWYITGNNGWTVIITSSLSCLIGFANYVVIAFRQNAILPWDLLSVGTAAKVAGNYQLPITSSLALSAACFVAVLFLGFSMLGQKNGFNVSKRIIASFVLGLSLIGSFFFIQSSIIGKVFPLNDSLFAPTYYFQRNGYVVGFVRSLQYVDVEEPVGYSAEESAAILASHSEGNSEDPEVYPNIIVVMNETFSDLCVLGDFSTNEEYMPFFSSLKENAIKGKLHVSVKGGNTANSEFEFLTGNSMAFLPTGSVPYELYLKDSTPSIVSYLKEQYGYTTYAVHPYFASAWRRNTVYPLLGFDKLSFIDDFDKDAHRIRDFTSDAATYNKIIELYEERASGERFFNFCVTLQNHGGYSILYDDFQPTVKVDGLETDVALNQYLSLIKESDAAFEKLINYFSKVDEPTIILMFGDHQPDDSAIQGLLNQLKHKADSLVALEKQYITDFVLWANYDIEEDYVNATSCNYLSLLLMEKAGLALSPYQSYLKTVQNKYPVITANCIVDNEGNYIPSFKYREIDDLDAYSKVQYYQFFE